MQNFDNHLAMPVASRSVTIPLAVISTATLLVGLYWLHWTSAIWFRYHPHLPWRDLLVLLRDIIEFNATGLTYENFERLIAPHYHAHRIAIPRLLLWMDINLAGGRSHVFYATAALSMLAIFLCYARGAFNYFEDRSTQVFAASLALILLCSPSHSWNLLNAINSSWHITIAFSILSATVLLTATDGLSITRWMAAGSLAVLASFATFGGLVSVLLLPLLALLFDRRALVAVLVVTSAFTWWYTRGVLADADIVSAWKTGSPEVVAALRETANQALDQQTLLNLGRKSLLLLSWPWSQTALLWPLVAATISVLLLACTWLYAIRQFLGRPEPMHPWLLLCMSGASVCLGIVVAAQLGRLIEQPNHMHGPSYERYQTLVVCYWIFSSGLALSAISKLTGALKPLGMLGIAATVWCLIVPQGSYLKEEIESVEAAAVLYTQGEAAHQAGATPQGGNRFSPGYIFSFDALFKSRALAYRVSLDDPADPSAPTSCRQSPASIRLTESDDGTLAMTVSLPWRLAAATRDIIVLRDGKFSTRLQPSHLGDYSPLSLVSAGENAWKGRISHSDSPESDLFLLMSTPFGLHSLCRLDRQD